MWFFTAQIGALQHVIGGRVEAQLEEIGEGRFLRHGRQFVDVAGAGEEQIADATAIASGLDLRVDFGDGGEFFLAPFLPLRSALAWFNWNAI